MLLRNMSLYRSKKLQEIPKSVKKKSSPTKPIPNIILPPQENVFTHEPEEELPELEGRKSLDEFRQFYKTMSEENPQLMETFTENYHVLPREYLNGLFKDTYTILLME